MIWRKSMYRTYAKHFARKRLNRNSPCKSLLTWNLHIMSLMYFLRIDRYTRMAPALSQSTFPLQTPLTANMPAPQPSMPGSPSASMKTNPSMTNPLDRITPSDSVASQQTSHTAAQQPGLSISRDGPLYTTQAARMNPSFSTGDIASLVGSSYGGGRERSTSSGKPMRSATGVFDGMEPRMFPGVVDKSTRRRSSNAQSGSFSLFDGGTGSTGAQSGSADGTGQKNDVARDVIAESE